MSESSHPGLARVLTLVPATALILASVIGTGVFVKARVMTCNVGSPELVLVVWLVAGLLTLAGALVYAELGTMMPRPGGEFHFVRAAFGTRWAFLFGWTKTLSMGASLAAISILCVVFMNDLLDGALSTLPLQLLPLVVIAVATAINLATMRFNGHAATALTAIKVALVVAIGGGAFLLADGTWSNYALTGTGGTCEGVPESARLGIGGFGAAMLGALWGYNGWAIVVSVGGEIKDPSRNIPLALFGGTLLIVVLYLLINAAYFYVLTPQEVASVGEQTSVAFEAASRFMGSGVAALMSACLMMSAYGTLHAGLLSGPRVPYTMAQSGLMPARLAKLNDRAVPAIAVVGIGIWSIVLAASGTFDVLTDIYVFVLWVFFAMIGVAVMILRRRFPDYERPYRVLGYPAVPIVFIAVSAYLLINTLMVTPGRALAGIALIASGLPFYYYFKRRQDIDEGAVLEQAVD